MYQPLKLFLTLWTDNDVNIWAALSASPAVVMAISIPAFSHAPPLSVSHASLTNSSDQPEVKGQLVQLHNRQSSKFGRNRTKVYLCRSRTYHKPWARLEPETLQSATKFSGWELIIFIAKNHKQVKTNETIKAKVVQCPVNCPYQREAWQVNDRKWGLSC